MGPRIGRIALWGSALSVVALLAACSTGPQSDPTQFPLPPEGFPDYNQHSTYAEAARQFDIAAESIAVPPGTHLVMFEHVVETGDDGKPYEPGLTPYEGWSAAEMGGLCLWVGEWLATRETDATRAATAVEQIAAFQKTWSFLYDSDTESAQPFYKKLADTTALGDPSAAMSHFTNNCAPAYHDQFPG